MIPAIAFDAAGGHVNDYFSIPEIVEDICISFHQDNGVDLMGEYRASTVPRIVKFKDPNTSSGCLDTALSYVWDLVHGSGNVPKRCFFGRMESIPGNRILKVYSPSAAEYMDERHFE